MQNISETKTLPYSTRQLFELVIDVEKYHEFLPWVAGCSIISKEEDTLTADMTISFKGISQSYRSKIKYQISEDGGFIDVTAISGPFKTLHNLWNFTALDKGTKLEFSVDLEFNSSLLKNILSGALKSVLHKMIIAFEKRAMEKYGTEN